MLYNCSLQSTSILTQNWNYCNKVPDYPGSLPVLVIQGFLKAVKYEELNWIICYVMAQHQLGLTV